MSRPVPVLPAKDRPRDEDTIAQHGFFSRLTLGHITPIIRLAFRQQRLEITDLWRTGPLPDEVYRRFEALWQVECERRAKPSLAFVVWLLIRKEFLFTAFFWVFVSNLLYAGPLILYQLVRFVEVQQEYGSRKACEDQAAPADRHLCIEWVGYLMPAAFFLLLLVQAVLTANMIVLSLGMMLKVRAALVVAIYKKTFRLSAIGLSTSSAGQLNTLMSNDAQQLVNFAPILHASWSVPLKIVVALSLLISSIGFSGLAGVAVILFFIPMQTRATKVMAALRKSQLKAIDVRVKITNEALQGIRVTKAYGWEENFIQRIGDARVHELSYIWKAIHYRAFIVINALAVPTLMSVAVFATYAMSGNTLTPSTVFSSLALLGMMRTPMQLLPGIVQASVSANVAVRRLGEFLQADERPLNERRQEQPACCITAGSFAWPTTEPAGSSSEPSEHGHSSVRLGGQTLVKSVNHQHIWLAQSLVDINFKVQPGKLVAIVGPVGAGKTSLLMSLLGETETLFGKVDLQGRLAYVPQQAFILNATVQDNIEFGIKSQSGLLARYRQALEACALIQDLESLPAGDQTEIGERGVTVSGGQKQRISLARACLIDADVYLFDDPLSAVDAHVGRHIFSRCLKGMLEGKSRVLVTHQVQYIPHCDYTYVMDQGRIIAHGTYQELVTAGVVQEQEPIDLADEKAVSGDEVEQKATAMIAELSAGKPGSLVQAEEKRSGAMMVDVLKAWITASGIGLALLAVLGQCVTEAAKVMVDVWLSAWSRGEGFGMRKSEPRSPEFYCSIYVGIAFTQVVLIYARAILWYGLVCVRCSANLHARLLSAVMAAPICFFDTTPLGRVLNRFTFDIDIVDNVLPTQISALMTNLTAVTSSVTLMAAVEPFILFAAFPLLAIYYALAKYYRFAQREMQRLEATTRSPIFVIFSEVLNGLSTIRAFRVEDFLSEKGERAVDNNGAAQCIAVAASQWLSLRLDCLGIVLVTLTLLLPLFSVQTVDAALVGLASAYALEITQYLKNMASTLADVEAKFTSVERIHDYSKFIKPEKPWKLPSDSKLSSSWPQAGRLQLLDVTMRYRLDLQPALRNVSFELPPCTKLGVCGRTGSGKSSLILAILRLVEFEGKIRLDGIDLQEIGLHRLRHRVAMIPQDPVLFHAPLRANLDPLATIDDDKLLWHALECVLLKTEIERLGGLETLVSDAGANFSVGQRQLLCLARAVLRDSRLVLLDEATASVDLETDSAIQRTIRRQFKETTVLTIAHRINTILDSDLILVMSSGEVAEFSSPKELLAREDSQFAELVRSSGAADTVTSSICAREQSTPLLSSCTAMMATLPSVFQPSNQLSPKTIGKPAACSCHAWPKFSSSFYKIL